MNAPEPWSVDRRDPLMVVDRDSRIVAVATSAALAGWIVRCANAVSGLPPEALDRTVLDEFMQVLQELGRYHTDPEYRQSLEKAGDHGPLFARAVRTQIKIVGVR
jgi:hypothetical protein